MLEPKALIKPNTRWQNVLIIISVLIPIVVAILIYLPPSARVELMDVHVLPHLNGMLNTATAIALLVSLGAILTKRPNTHKNANFIAFGLSAIFLVCYVLYHYSAAPTLYGDLNHDGILTDLEKANAPYRGLYVGLLLSHIVLAVAVVPLVLFSMYYSLSGQFAKHKRLSRFTWPVWFYVAVTGVIVYLMIRPYYPIIYTL